MFYDYTAISPIMPKKNELWIGARLSRADWPIENVSGWGLGQPVRGVEE